MSTGEENLNERLKEIVDVLFQLAGDDIENVAKDAISALNQESLESLNAYDENTTLDRVLRSILYIGQSYAQKRDEKLAKEAAKRGRKRIEGNLMHIF